MRIDRRQALSLMTVAPLAGPAFAEPARGGTIRPEALTVEWQDRPVGLDRRRPRFAWKLAVPPGTRDARQSAFRLVVAEDPDAARLGRGSVWDSGIMSASTTLARPPQDLPLKSHSVYWWSIRCADGDGRWSDWARPARCVTGLLDPADWRAEWIAAEADRTLPPHVAGQAPRDAVPARPLPLFRRDFIAATKPRRAILSVAGLGHYALWLNGQPIGDAALASGWTNYRRTILYDSYDVTRLLAAGPNTLALMLGNGLYNVEHKAGRYTKFLDSFGQPKAILLLTIEQADGRRVHIATDKEWRTRTGPILFSSIYGGEDVDARVEPAGWREPGFSAEGWSPVRVVAGPGGRLRASSVPPVTVGETIVPVAITEPAPGVTLIDFGRNFAGRPVIELAAGAGTTAVLTPAEALDGTGRADQRSFNGGPGRRVEFRYTAAGRGIERFEPRFTYHGFRYVEVSGVPRAAIRSIRGNVLHAAIPRAGTFAAADAGLTAIHRLIDAAVTSNMVSVLTDCPHREKLGWLEQTYLNAPTVFYNRDAAPLYEKLVDDMAEAQQTDGMIPGIAPEYVAFVDKQGRDQIWRNSPEWGVAAVLAPWAAYRFRGDPSILAAAWSAAARYCRYLDGRAQDGLIDFGMGDWYDVGPREPGEAQLTSRILTGTAVHIEALQTMARIAPIIGKGSEAADYGARAAAAARALNRRFLDARTGRYDRGSQTAMAMPLALGIVPDAVKERAEALLIAAVRAADNGVTAGDIGFRYVIEALAQAGRDDVVLDMLRVRDRPSYAYQIAQGATALTEAWDANPTKSLNHFMLGHAEGWLYGRLAGLRIDHAQPEPRALTVAPVVLPTVDGASASHETMSGRFASQWRLEGRRLTVAVEIPAGRWATLLLADVSPTSLREGGNPLSRLAKIRIAQDHRAVRVEIGSGRYVFTANRRLPV